MYLEFVFFKHRRDVFFIIKGILAGATYDFCVSWLIIHAIYLIPLSELQSFTPPAKKKIDKNKCYLQTLTLRISCHKFLTPTPFSGDSNGASHFFPHHYSDSFFFPILRLISWPSLNKDLRGIFVGPFRQRWSLKVRSWFLKGFGILATPPPKLPPQ